MSYRSVLADTNLASSFVWSHTSKFLPLVIMFTCWVASRRSEAAAAACMAAVERAVSRSGPVVGITPYLTRLIPSIHTLIRRCTSWELPLTSAAGGQAVRSTVV